MPESKFPLLDSIRFEYDKYHGLLDKQNLQIWPIKTYSETEVLPTEYWWMGIFPLQEEGSYPTVHDAGSEKTARLLYKYKDNDEVLKDVWIAACIKTFLSSSTNGCDRSWWGHPYMMLTLIRNELRDKYHGEMTYHHASTTGLPPTPDLKIYAPTTSPKSFGSIITALQFYVTTFWGIVVRSHTSNSPPDWDEYNRL